MKFSSVISHPYTGLALRLGIGGFFLVAAVSKIAQPTFLFANQIRSFGVIPDGWETPLAHALPWVELFSGWFFLVGIFTTSIGALLGFQLFAFIVVLSISIFLGLAPEDCGCLPGVSETPGQALIRDLVMVFWLLLSYRALPGSLSLDRWLGRR